MKIRKIKINKDRKKISLKPLLVTAFIGFIVGNILLTLFTFANGSKLISLEKEAGELIKTNNELSEKLIDSTSLTNASSVSSSLGYNKPTEIVYMKEFESVAKLP